MGELGVRELRTVALSRCVGPPKTCAVCRQGGRAEARDPERQVQLPPGPAAPRVRLLRRVLRPDQLDAQRGAGYAASMSRSHSARAGALDATVTVVAPAKRESGTRLRRCGRGGGRVRLGGLVWEQGSCGGGSVRAPSGLGSRVFPVCCCCVRCCLTSSKSGDTSSFLLSPVLFPLVRVRLTCLVFVRRKPSRPLSFPPACTCIVPIPA